MSAEPKRAAASSGDGGCCGCIFWVFAGLVLWALLFGVTVGGRHYGLAGCDATHGLILDRGDP